MKLRSALLAQQLHTEALSNKKMDLYSRDDFEQVAKSAQNLFNSLSETHPLREHIQTIGQEMDSIVSAIDKAAILCDNNSLGQKTKNNKNGNRFKV